MATLLAPDELQRRCDPRDLPFATTDEVTDPLDASQLAGQARAIDAVELGIGIRHDGYNLFALGPHGLGKQTMLRELVTRRALTQPTPSDWCYVNDLHDPRAPRALELPAGAGARLRGELARAVAELKVALPAAFDSDELRSRRQQLVQDFKRQQEGELEELQRRARDRRVGVVRTETGIVLAPLRGQDVLDPEEFERLPAAEQETLKHALEEVGAELSEMFRRVHERSHQHRTALLALERATAAAVAHRVIEGVRTGFREVAAVATYLDEIEADVVDHAELFLVKPDGTVDDAVRHALRLDDGDDGRFRRYAVNVLTDHGATRGAPVVVADNPTYANLFGRVEHTAQLGALVTDFTLIRPGALHEANGGYLLLDALKVLQQPLAWQALGRALRRREVRIESPGQALGLTSTATLEPAPIPLRDVKVVLFGERLLYYLLASYDPDFADLFKVMVDFEDSLERRRETDVELARLIAGLVRRHQLRGFDRGAVARVIDHAARLAGDAQRLSIHLRSIVDLLIEADHATGVAGRATVGVDEVQAAIDARLRRTGRLRARALASIRRGTHLIETRGERVGQINGLSVLELGGDAFGQPSRITARARLGKGEVLDLEREVELGGPIHSKGVLILTGLLGARYAARTPLSLSATIVFEQSYGGVEGDSASLAELCALLSAIGEVPLTQALAVTGSIDQHGQVQPIGGVNEKIEGFFDVCRERGLTGREGVIIPRANVQHLMLRRDVIAAVAERRFQLHAVERLEDALALLTGQAAEAVEAQVRARLAGFAEDARGQLAPPPGS